MERIDAKRHFAGEGIAMTGDAPEMVRVSAVCPDCEGRTCFDAPESGIPDGFRVDCQICGSLLIWQGQPMGFWDSDEMRRCYQQ